MDAVTTFDMRASPAPSLISTHDKAGFAHEDHEISTKEGVEDALATRGSMCEGGNLIMCLLQVHDTGKGFREVWIVHCLSPSL